MQHFVFFSPLQIDNRLRLCISYRWRSLNQQPYTKKSNQLQCFDNDPFTIASYQLLLCTEEEKKCNTNLDYPPILPQSHLWKKTYNEKSLAIKILNLFYEENKKNLRNKVQGDVIPNQQGNCRPFLAASCLPYYLFFCGLFFFHFYFLFLSF